MKREIEEQGEDIEPEILWCESENPGLEAMKDILSAVVFSKDK